MSEAVRNELAPGERRVEPRPATELPDRRMFWAWVWSAVRPVVGWVLVALGALALFLGWYGVSGEALTAKQLPYLISGGLTGIALIILAGVFLATEDVRRQLARVNDMERKLDELYALFVEDLTAPRPSSDGSIAANRALTVVALPSGTSYHRGDCGLVTGKSDAVEVDAAAVRDRGLRPCRVCEPPALGPL
jgi:hypothetical protein